MNCKRGDVVILDYPFSDAGGSKVRPAVVVQSDRNNARMTNTIVAMITKNLQRVNEPTQLLIDVATAEGRQSGVHVTSAVNCANLFTIHERHIIHTIGRLSSKHLQAMDGCLKAALELT